MSRKIPATVLKGVRLDFDGVETLLILTPFSLPDPAAPPKTPEQVEKSHRVMEQMMALHNKGVAVFVAQMPDGTFAPVSRPDMKEKIRARNISLSDFLPLPIYETDL
jgi:hypothetical protein